jgi:hypothetical protein
MYTAEPSYFVFLMHHRCGRRLRVASGQAAGVMPDIACAMRARLPQRMEFGQKIAPGR